MVCWCVVLCCATRSGTEFVNKIIRMLHFIQHSKGPVLVIKKIRLPVSVNHDSFVVELDLSFTRLLLKNKKLLCSHLRNFIEHISLWICWIIFSRNGLDIYVKCFDILIFVATPAVWKILLHRAKNVDLKYFYTLICFEV